MNQTVIIHPANTEQMNALKAFAKALKMKLEVTGRNPYDKDFVDMVLHAEEEIKKGKGKKVSVKEFDDLWK
jgi:hypothetical protein